MRVLHVINGEFYSGAEKVQDVLAQRLPEFGFQVGFACIKPNLFPRVRQSRGPLTEIPMRCAVDFARCFDLATCIRKGRYKIIHTHTPRTCVVGRLAAALTNVPMLHHMHSPTIRDTLHRRRNIVNALVERLSLVGVGHIIAVSESLKRYLVTLKFPRTHISVVHNGVPERGDLVRRPTPINLWTIGIVGLFRPRKGVPVLLNALAYLKEEQFPLRLIAVGPFETLAYETKIKQLANRLGLDDKIEWLGFTEDVDSKLAQMDMLVLPSLFGEGLPMVMLEAMAAGVPIVASEVGGISEAVRNGHEGLLVKPGNPRELAVAIKRIITGDVDWQALRTRAHRRHAQVFSDRRMARGIAAIYNRMLCL